MSITPVVIYARYSTLMQDARSIDDQERRCRAYAASHGMSVMAVYSDAAESGSHIEREGMQRLLKDARAKGSKFRAVLVDDLSRLSRDLGNTWQVVFGDLADRDVAVVDCTSGMSSADASARITFAALGMVNDQFLQSVRKMTHRGLEGRALAGFHTGGKTYGYHTVTEPNPPDPEHPRKVVVIEETEAAIVRRVFAMYEQGHGLRAITIMLNDEGIEPPHGGNKRGKGWVHTTLRAMLMNPRYIGRFTWNKHKWVTSGRKNRRRVERPESEWITREVPDLAIIERSLWDVVQARFGRRVRHVERATSKYPVPLLSGILFCHTCGGRMVILSRRKKATRTYAQFGCQAHFYRGKTICANGATISEHKVNDAMFGSLQELLDSPELVARFVDVAQKKIAARIKEAASATKQDSNAKREAALVKSIANVTEALSKVGWSDALGAKLKADEAALVALRAERSQATQAIGATIPTPHPAMVAAAFRDLLGLLSKDPIRGREFLARYVGEVSMRPLPEGSKARYEGTGALNLSFLLGGEKTGAEVISCAGWI
jgi:site-specific DNA recombinase